MAPDHPSNTSDYEGAAAAYAQHAEGQRSAREAKHKEDLEAQAASPVQSTGWLESVDGPLTEEAKFVANPEGLRKEVDSEEKFSEGLKDNPVDVEVGSVTVTEPVNADELAPVEEPKKTAAAKKAPAKATAKKAAAKK